MMERLVGSFFFQAEDGIRDLYVTGVQTCALPICSRRAGRAWRGRRPGPADRSGTADGPEAVGAPGAVGVPGAAGWSRSEERRVGKEWRSRWSADASIKNYYLGYLYSRRMVSRGPI